MKQCPACGTQYTDDAVFCQKCGGKLVSKEVCPHCGKETEPEQFYCTFCGTRLREDAPTGAPEAKPAQEQPARQEPKKKPQESSGGPAAEKAAAPGGAAPEKGRKLLRARAYLAIGLLVALCVVAIPYYIYTANKAQKEAVTNEFRTQANLSNYGRVAKVNDKIYATDVETGIYELKNGEYTTRIAEGMCYDLAASGSYLYYVQRQFETGRIQIRQVNTATGKYEVLANVDEIGDVKGLGVIDGDYYFTINRDRLFCVDLNGNKTSTTYRNVKQITSEGVFTSANDDLGLMYISNDGKECIEYDRELSDKNVFLWYVKDNAAVISYVEDRVSPEGDMKEAVIIARVTLLGEQLEILFDSAEWEADQPYPSTVYSVSANDYNGQNVVAVSAYVEEEPGNRKPRTFIYYTDALWYEPVLVWTDDRYCIANVAVIDDNFYIRVRNDEKDSYEIEVIPAPGNGAGENGTV